MLKLKNSVKTYFPIIPSYFEGKIEMSASCEIPEELAILFSQGLNALAYEMISHNISKENLNRVTLIFTSNGECEMKEEGETTYARYSPVVIYIMDKIISSNDKHKQLFIFIEELVHHFLRNENETSVKLSTLQILQHIFKEMTLEEVLLWGVNWS